MSNTSYVPGVGGLPYGNRNLNPQGSAYGTESEFDPVETNLIAKAIHRKIFDAAPAQFDSLKVAFSKPFEDVNLDEHEYNEITFGRSPIIASANAAAVAAVPGAHVTQTITLTAGSLARIRRDVLIIYPDGVSKANVASIAGNQITVNSYTSAGLPAVTAQDVFAIQSSIRADGMSALSDKERMDHVTRYNYVQFFMRVQQWSTVELQKHKNAGTTNYLELDKEQKMKQLRIDLFNSYWNGLRGEVVLSDGSAAKSMGGIYPTMLAAGSANISTSLAGFQTAFETAAFATNYKVEGATRFVYGTDESLNEFSKIYKQPGLRYEPNNEVANLKLRRIEVGTMNFVLVPCELWREESCFTADWQRRLIILDQDTIQPVKIKGIPAMNVGQTGDLDKGFTTDFIQYWNTAQMSLRFNNPVGSFIINLL